MVGIERLIVTPMDNQKGYDGCVDAAIVGAGI